MHYIHILSINSPLFIYFPKLYTKKNLWHNKLYSWGNSTKKSFSSCPIRAHLQPTNVRVVDQSEGAARSQRGQRPQIKYLTLVHPTNVSSPGLAGLSVTRVLVPVLTWVTSTTVGWQSAALVQGLSSLLAGTTCYSTSGEAASRLGEKCWQTLHDKEPSSSSGRTKVDRAAAPLQSTPGLTWHTVRNHDSSGRRFDQDDETDSSSELPAGRILSGR